MKFLISLIVLVDFLYISLLWGEDAKPVVEVFPATPIHQYAIYGNLAIFWIGILGLLVIIRMKLREIERVQRMGLDKEQS